MPRELSRHEVEVERYRRGLAETLERAHVAEGELASITDMLCTEARNCDPCTAYVCNDARTAIRIIQESIDAWRRKAGIVSAIREVLGKATTHHMDTCSAMLIDGYECDCGKAEADKLLEKSW